MSVETFLATAYWGARLESPAEIAARLLRTAEALSPLHPLLRSWLVLDRYVEQDFVPLERVRSRIASVVEDFVVRDDYDEPDPESGYNWALLNTMERTPEAIAVDGVAGLAQEPRFSQNTASFRTLFDCAADPELVAYPLFKAAMMTLVQVQDAPIATATCSALLAESRASNRLFRPMWMAYLAAPVARRIVPPSDVLCETTPDGGLLMLAAEDTIDPNNPAHVAAAFSISDALLPIKDRADL